MSKQEKIREQVSRDYAKAVTKPTGTGCCQPTTDTSTCCSAPVSKGQAVKLAGYDEAALAELPPDTVVNSFGCGNPVAYSGVEAGDVVVDLGSGAGIDILIAGKKVGPSGHVIGVDMTDEMIQRAEENIRASGLTNVEVRKGIIEDLPVDSATVDWVISNCVINLSPEKPKVFAEIARVLKPGGQMMVSDIVVEDLPDWVRENEILYSSCVAGAISEAQYINGLCQSGLVDIEVRDRLIYDASMLKGLIQSELSDTDSSIAELMESIGQQKAAEVIQQLAGQIWSINVYARKTSS
jgi:SAM-dependent methyltransferase